MSQFTLRCCVVLTAFTVGVVCAVCFTSVSQYQRAVLQKRESVLHENLALIRKQINKYTSDTGRPPRSVTELVESGYMNELPIDPISGDKDWNFIYDYYFNGVSFERGIVDVRSSATIKSSQNKSYEDW
jgi:general secretion pathway protein G